jgi:hypothetical protein
MGLVYDAFKRNRAQLHVPRALKERPQAAQAVAILRPVRAIKRLMPKLPVDERQNAKKFCILANRLPRHLIEFGYHRFERITRYANYGS